MIMSTLTVKDTQLADWRRGALPLSLILNLFLIALIGGYWLRNELPGSRPALQAAPIGRVLAGLEGRLSPTDAAALRAAMARGAPSLAPASQRLLQARIDLTRQITAERVDREATRRAFLAWRASWDEVIEDLSDPLTDALAQISPEGRRQLVLAAEQRRERRIGPAIP
jgi:uncharacterized membrane protein